MAILHLSASDTVALCGEPMSFDRRPESTDTLCPICVVVTVKHLRKMADLMLEVNQKVASIVEVLSKRST